MAIVDRQTSRVRTLLGASATAVLAGIAFAAAGEQTLGGWLSVLALLTLIWNVHRLGRLGSDELDGAKEASRGAD